MISWAAILSSTKLAHHVKVGAEGAGAGRAAEVGAVVMAEVVVAVVADGGGWWPWRGVAAVDEIAVIVACGGGGRPSLGNRLPTIKICNVTGELAEAGSPVCFPRFFSLLKSRFCFYAFPREFLWLHYMSKTSPKNSMKRCVAAASARRRSIAAEVLALLEENVPTAQELKARQDLLRKLVRMRAKRPNSSRVFPSTEEMPA